MKIGKDKVEKRTHQLNRRLKEGIKEMGHIQLITPLTNTLSSGINCFLVKGQKADETVAKLHEKHIIASSTPYKVQYARLTPAILNNEQEVDACIQALQAFA